MPAFPDLLAPTETPGYGRSLASWAGYRGPVDTFTPPSWATAFYSAWQNAAAGNGQAHIAVFGDSVSQGAYATAPLYTNSWAGRLPTLLAADTGVSVGTGAIPIYENYSTVTLDDRITPSGTWATVQRGPYAAASRLIGRAGSSPATMTFTATGRYFRVYYSRESNSGNWSYTVDGGSSVNSGAGSGTTLMQMLEIDAGTDTSHTIVLTGPTGGNFLYLHHVEAIRNPTSGVKVSRMALSDMRCSDLILNTTVASSLGSATYVDPDLAIIGFGLNEALTGVTTATYRTNMDTLIDHLQTNTGCSVIIFIAPPPNPATIPEATWTNFRNEMLDIAADQGCGVVDISTRWVSRAASLSLYSDNVHPNNAGHADIATAVHDVIAAAVGV